MAVGPVREPGCTRPCCRRRFKSSLSPPSRHRRSRGLGIINSKNPPSRQYVGAEISALRQTWIVDNYPYRQRRPRSGSVAFARHVDRRQDARADVPRTVPGVRAHGKRRPELSLRPGSVEPGYLICALADARCKAALRGRAIAYGDLSCRQPVDSPRGPGSRIFATPGLNPGALVRDTQVSCPGRV